MRASVQNEFFKKASVNFNKCFYAPHGQGWYSNATVQCERGVQPRARPSHKIPASPALAAMRLLGAGLSGLYHGRPPSSSSVCRGLQMVNAGRRLLAGRASKCHPQIVAHGGRSEEGWHVVYWGEAAFTARR